MARISNTSVYPNINPVLSDYFVLTDANDSLATKSCTLENLKSLFNLNVVSETIVVPSTSLSRIATDSITLLPLSGSAFVYDIQRILVFMDPGSTPYNFSTDLPTIDLGSLATGDIQLATLNSSADAVAQIYTGGGAATIPNNSALILSKAGSNPTAGNGTLYINVTYRKLKLDNTF